MAIAVVLIVIAVVLAASVRWWRHAQGDQRSVEAYHTLINRLRQIDAQNHVDERVPVDEPGPGPKPGLSAGAPAPQIRVVPTRAPSGRPPQGGRQLGPEQGSGPVEGADGEGAGGEGAGGEGTGAGDWGPPVRLLPHPRQEPVPAPVARPGTRPAQSTSRPGQTSRMTAARPLEPTRPVMFFDDFATAARRPKPMPTAIAIREGDRPWLGTARQYAFPVTTALVAVVISLASLAIVSSSGAGARKVVSSNHPHGGGAPAPASSVSVAPASAAPAAVPAPSSSSSSAPPAPAATGPASPGNPAATGSPQLSMVWPASGVPGQEVTLAGAGLFSSDGLIVVRFGAAQAAVACPNQTTCQAIVPNTPPGSAPTGAQMITVSTGAGTSNSLKFTYTS